MMNCRQIAAVLLLSLVAALPAAAGETKEADPRSRIDPGLFLQGILTERDVTLLFDHLRLSLAAAAEGREPPPALELEQRAAAIGDQLRLRGTLFGLVMLNALEARAKEALRPPREPDATAQGIPRQD